MSPQYLNILIIAVNKNIQKIIIDISNIVRVLTGGELEVWKSMFDVAQRGSSDEYVNAVILSSQALAE